MYYLLCVLFTRADIEIRLFYPIDPRTNVSQMGEPFRYYGPPIRLG